MARWLGLWFGAMLGAKTGNIIPLLLLGYFGYRIGRYMDEALGRHEQQQPFDDPFQTPREHFRKLDNIPIVPYFSIVGHLAKMDGRVVEAEIAFTKQIMRSMGLNHHDRTLAIHAFRLGKSAEFSLNPAIMKLSRHLQHEYSLKQLLFKWLVELCQVAILTERKYHSLVNIAQALGIVWNTEQQTASQVHDSLQEAYTVLGCQPSDNPDVLKKCYRKLMGEHHPDRLPADADEATKHSHAEKVIAIRKAYDTLRKNRGF